MHDETLHDLVYRESLHDWLNVRDSLPKAERPTRGELPTADEDQAAVDALEREQRRAA